MKILWLIDAVLLLAALGVALFATGQDAAGRGMVWFFPVAIGLALLASWGAARAGSRGIALGLGAVAPLVVLVVAVPLGRSALAERRERGGAAYWDAAPTRAVARAIAARDTAALRAAARGADLNAAGRDGTTPLEFAVARYPDMIAPLVALGANPNPDTPGRLPPLGQALRARDAGGEMAFDALLTAGADPNAMGESEASLLFMAIRLGRPDRAAKLIARGADVTAIDPTGRTTAVAAAEEGQWALARDLLARGADPAAVAGRGVSLGTVVDGARAARGDDADFRAVAAAVR